MTQRSKFLIHWTHPSYMKKRKNKRPKNHTERDDYIEHLKIILEEGLRFKKNKEITRQGETGYFLTPDVKEICFTEIKLSAAKEHARKYGWLGIGFDREFVCDRLGNPVFYMRNHSNNIMIKRLQALAVFLKNINNPSHKIKILLEDNDIKVADLRVSLNIALSFTKQMSEKDNDSHTFKTYEEMEWRIVKLGKHQEKYYYIENEEKPNEKCHLYITPPDVKIIVFPDAKTKERSDQLIRDYFIDKNIIPKSNTEQTSDSSKGKRSKKKKSYPILATLDDCANF